MPEPSRPQPVARLAGLGAWLAAPTPPRVRAMCAAALLILAVVSLALFQPVALPVLEWMLIYAPTDFRDASWVEIGEFFLGLRTGIPPVLSFLEIACVRLFGTTAPIDVWLYRAALAAAFSLPVLLFDKSRLALATSTLACGVFLAATLRIHPGNPQLYDVVMPLLLLVALGALDRSARPPGDRPGLAAAAGLALAVAELTRPYFLALLPIFLLLAFRLRISRRARAAFLAPLVLLSGFWHAKLLIWNGGQFGWSNHSAFNLERAWPIPKAISERAAPIDASYLPRRPGRWLNLDTETHYQNGRRLLAEVVRYYRERPSLALAMLLKNTRAMLATETDINEHRPRHPTLRVYRLVTRVLLVLALLSGVALLWRLVRRPGAETRVPANALVATTNATLLLLANGDSYERARFMISLLPLLAAEPWRFRWAREDGAA